MRTLALSKILLSPRGGGGFPTADGEVYVPMPLETSSISLGDEILKLTDILAENSHDIWARERIAQGWKWGPVRDDQNKLHPRVVPYKELPDADKHINRQMALESLKMAMSLGLVRSDDRGRDIAALNVSGIDADSMRRETILSLKDEDLTLRSLRQIWESRLPLVWLRDASLYRLAAEAALQLGEWFFAFDIAEEGLTGFRGDLRLKQLMALGLARTGATKRANQILQQLRASGNEDEETLGLLARTYKDFWLIATDPDERQRHLAASYAIYKKSYDLNGGYYSGINAAALAFCLDDLNQARQLAGEVAAICRTRQNDSTQNPDETYWLQATLAEALLILGETEQAREQYKRAAKIAGKQWPRLSRTREQARLLLRHAGRDPHCIDDCFTMPSLIVCSGHMFDRPDRAAPRFPYAMRDEVYRQIEQRLDAMNAGVGFCSLACGSDMLFADALLKRGGELHIVLPFNPDDFKASSVDRVPGMNFSAEFDRILNAAASVTVLNATGRPDDGAVYDYCNHVLIGMASLKARLLGLEAMALVIWDLLPGDGAGGTSSFVEAWRRLGRDIQLIRIREATGSNTALQPDPATPTENDFPPQEIRALLFADVKGYTKLSEIQIPAFVETFLTEVAGILDAMPSPPVVRNTWGDAIYCAFDSVADAGAFALKLQSFVVNTDWKNRGLPDGLNIRIALHAGPVYRNFDPITQKMTYLGAHVNRTARIEPIADENQVFASQAFAAYAEVNQCSQFVCEYVGQKRLPKNFGLIPVFLVQPPVRM